MRISGRPLRALVVGLALLVATPAVAQSERDEAGALVEKGLEHARAGRFAEAAEQFEAALRLYPHPDIMHNMARAQEELGNLPEAHRYFLKALGMDPSYTHAEDARRRVALTEEALRQTHGLLKISSTPSQVEVEIVQGGQSLAAHLVTPTQEWVPVGKALIQGRKSGFVENTVEVDVAAGVDLQVEVVLRPIQRKGFLSVAANVKNANVWVDGEAFGTTPLPSTPVAAGSHTVRVEIEGYKRYEQQILVKPDEEARILATLISLKEDVDTGSLGIVGGSLMGAGGAAGVVGVVLHLSAFKAANDAAAVPNTGDPDEDAEFEDLQKQAQNLQIGAFVSYGVAAALVGTGIALVVLSADDGDDTAALGPEWVPTLAPIEGGAAAGAIVRF